MHYSPEYDNTPVFVTEKKDCISTMKLTTTLKAEKIDSDTVRWDDAMDEQVKGLPYLLETLAEYIEEDMERSDRYRQRELNNLLCEVRGWEQVETSVE